MSDTFTFKKLSNMLVFQCKGQQLLHIFYMCRCNIKSTSLFEDMPNKKNKYISRNFLKMGFYELGNGIIGILLLIKKEQKITY